MGLLHRTAKKFNTTPCEDAETGDPVLGAQLTVFNDVTRDGLTAERRIVEFTPESTPPEHGAILIGGFVHILGEVHYDYWKGTPIRKKYAAHQCPLNAPFYSGLEAVENFTSDPELWTQRAWMSKVVVRTIRDQKQDSDETERTEFYMHHTVEIQTGYFIDYGNDLYIVKSVYDSGNGFRVALAEIATIPQLRRPDNGALRGLHLPFQHRGETTIADPAGQELPMFLGLPLRWQAAYIYISPATTKFEAGDMQVLVSNNLEISAGDSVGGAGGHPAFTVYAVQNAEFPSFGGTKLVHLRRRL